jgi:hypothetical protein
MTSFHRSGPDTDRRPDRDWADAIALGDVVRAAGLFAAVLLVNVVVAALFFIWLQSWESPEVEANGVLPLLGAARPDAKRGPIHP